MSLRTVLFSFFIISCSCGLYYWDHVNQTELAESAKELDSFATADFAKSIELVVESQNLNRPDKIQPKGVEETNMKFVWNLERGLPNDGPIKKSTLDFLNRLKSLELQKTSQDILKTKEALILVTQLNQNPTQAKEVLEYLLGQQEVLGSNYVTGQILKISRYAQFNKDQLIEIADQLISASTLNPSDTKANVNSSKDELIKLKEATRLILDHASANKELLASHVKRLLSTHQHPLIKEEILYQLEVRYPEDAKALRQIGQEDGDENITEYLERESAP